jgi:hypothetical protein
LEESKLPVAEVEIVKKKKRKDPKTIHVMCFMPQASRISPPDFLFQLNFPTARHHGIDRR